MDPSPPTPVYSHSITPLTTPSTLPPLKTNLNASHLLPRTLTLYPFLASLAQHLDHTDLSSLASTCQQAHTNLSPYRTSLLSLSLQCIHAGHPASAARPPCTRDLVRPCTTCHAPLCRNCKTKPRAPAPHTRFRRLCTPCRRSPEVLKTAPRCKCADDAWICRACCSAQGRADEAYRVRCGAWAAAREGFRVQGGAARVGCARGRAECVGMEGQEGQEGYDDEEEEEEVEEEEGTVEEWDLESLQGMGYSEGRRREGRWVQWHGSVDLNKEALGEYRGVCSWCEGITLSLVDEQREREREEREGRGV
ncbi:hypothetical protein EDC01DRAFT_75677 [Geopyxis carbonaria]|nr:hypothetical protein EDC01DRAFT_75677 [Geopyxis carbonaria]